MENRIRFSELLAQHIVGVISKKFYNKPPTPETLREIRDIVREQVQSIFNKSTHRVSPDGMNWLANQLFKRLQISTSEGTQFIDELIVINDFKLDALPYTDIELLHNLFNETHMGPELDTEYRRRSQA